MYGILLRKEHVLEIESLVLRSIKEIEQELSTKHFNESVRSELLQKKIILTEVYSRLPL
ncbi:hypothetical protein [Gottfriedia solisilvae]|uniref:Uncharacterized protein n=2 Tax=Gottfriedia solisilvae TaxID=1516104 RepID=A0A8J3AWV3_9BACI|nr:hypothetical protein [Gottfriedia solisilvae]GGI18071.1 hypothetical protein GCM10007380_41090 [Gottfriedia solisilvae]